MTSDVNLTMQNVFLKFSRDNHVNRVIRHDVESSAALVMDIKVSNIRYTDILAADISFAIGVGSHGRRGTWPGPKIYSFWPLKRSIIGFEPTHPLPGI